MTLFFLVLVVIFALIVWQLVSYLRAPQGVGVRKTILIRIFFLIVVLGLCTYAWRATLLKETQLTQILLPYPDATLDILATPIFSDSPYWTYTTSATPDQIFNWYRSRAKHAGWTVAEDGGSTGMRIFVVKLSKTVSFFVVLQGGKKGTTITYTPEGQLIHQDTP